jgi:hypothetical protein
MGGDTAATKGNAEQLASKTEKPSYATCLECRPAAKDNFNLTHIALSKQSQASDIRAKRLTTSVTEK